MGVPSEVLAEAVLALLREQSEFTDYFRSLSGNNELEVKCSEWAEVMDAPSVAAAS